MPLVPARSAAITEDAALIPASISSSGARTVQGAPPVRPVVAMAPERACTASSLAALSRESAPNAERMAVTGGVLVANAPRSETSATSALVHIAFHVASSSPAAAKRDFPSRASGCVCHASGSECGRPRPSSSRHTVAPNAPSNVPAIAAARRPPRSATTKPDNGPEDGGVAIRIRRETLRDPSTRAPG